MNKHIVLIDFGASRIKSATLSPLQVLPSKNHDSPGSGTIGQTCPASFFAEALIEHLKIAEKFAPVDAIIICSEMHGYAVCDHGSGLPGEYVSWRHSSVGDKAQIAILNDNGFFELTGLKAKAGLPIVNILSGASPILDDGRPLDIAFIPDSICRLLGESYHKVHASLAHASGLYTLDNRTLAGFGLPALKPPTSSDKDGVCIGIIKFQGREVPCYGGYGDLQASVLGMEPNKDQWVINLGTGSQIVSLIPVDSNRFEKRAYFDKKMIDCITHIPAGRALSMFANLFSEIRNETSQDHFWQIMKNIKFNGNIDDLPVFDLATFPQAFEFSGGGSISNINEHHFDMNDFCLGLINSFVEQYIQLLNAAGCRSQRPIVLAGNLATEVPLITKLLETKWSNNISTINAPLEPTIAGLFRLADGLD